jgi:glucosyl-dolichyl phosphate glucuronosyltransferase
MGNACSISVVICAYTLDRWEDLCEAVQSVRNQVRPFHEIIVVVDHNSGLLQRAMTEFPDLLVVANREARGLSGGRNTGVAISNGSLVAFLDDDAVADPYWLSRLAEHCESPNVLGATARVMPLWIGERPGWLPEEFLWTVGCSYRGLPTSSREVRNVFGCAMLVSRQIFQRAGGFTAVLGRQGTSFLLSCEETELCIRARIVIPEGRFMLEPTSVVWHKVPSSRLTWAYFRSRCYAEGVSKAYIVALFGNHDVLATERRYALRALSAGIARGFCDFAFRLDADGLKRSAAIVLGLVSAAAGYFVTKLRFALLPRTKRHFAPACAPIGQLAFTQHSPRAPPAANSGAATIANAARLPQDATCQLDNEPAPAANAPERPAVDR